MPEITSVETIRSKLREFEERIDGAIAAAATLARIKSDAEKLVTHLQGIERKSERTDAKIEKSLEQAEGVRFQFNQLQHDWESLKRQADRTQGESKSAGEALHSKLDFAIQSLGNKLADAEERLKAENKTSQAEQAELLGRLAASTQVSADAATKAQAVVAETGARLESMLATLRDDLKAEIIGKTAQTETLLRLEGQRVEKHLNQEQETLRKGIESKAENYQRLLREEMNVFKSEMQSEVADHEQAIDRRLTDFLNRQNTMVENLTQQIDSFSRAAQAQAADLVMTNSKISALVANLHIQDGAIAALAQASQQTATRLAETLEKLKQVPLVGGKFR